MKATTGWRQEVEDVRWALARVLVFPLPFHLASRVRAFGDSARMRGPALGLLLSDGPQGGPS